ncbi:unnamed protein product [Amoebophrya sp. A120]|nr:unnamed protein product [Amoebophrya sp. A120]|eukprot:GSA120T00014211001.1
MADMIKTQALECPAQQAMGEKLPAMSPGLNLYPTICEGTHCMPNESGDAAADPNDLIPCFGCLFCIESLYCTFPACIGCSGNSEVLFCQQTVACCKPLDCKDAEKRCCACDNCNMYLMQPRTLVQCNQQCFCIDVRAALPCTKDVPMIVNMMGINCFPTTGCCKKLGAITGNDKK